MNTFEVNIKRNGEYVPLGATAVFPFSLGELLDERLDEAYITFYGSKVKAYRPTTEFKISVTDSYETTDYYFILAGDNSAEYPAGSGKYKHSCYLIERTKWLEGIVCSSLTFRNAKGAVYGLKEKSNPKPSYYSLTSYGDNPNISIADVLYPVQTPQKIGESVVFLSIEQMAEVVFDAIKSNISNSYGFNVVRLPPKDQTTENETGLILDSDGNKQTFDFESREVKPEITMPQIVKLEYIFTLDVRNSLNVNVDTILVKLNYLIAGVETVFPLRRFTITDVVNRCLELAEPLFMGQNPKYVFDGVTYASGEIAPYSEASKYRPGSLADIFDKVYAPEFNLTQDTLREQLKVIGGYIHGEPWIDENNVVYYQIFSDNARSRLEGHPNIGTSASWHINEYNTELRSNAQNLVSSLGYAKGVITDPGATLHRTLRTFPHCFIPLPNCI